MLEIITEKLIGDNRKTFTEGIQNKAIDCLLIKLF
jgi:enolase